MADQHDQAVDEEQSNFPGINKRHGFFKAIERNQRDRDHYHQEWEEWREVEHDERTLCTVSNFCLFVFLSSAFCLWIKGRKGEVKREWRGTKRKPQKPLYCPPHTRERRPAALYRLEIEVRPNVWHRQTVHKVCSYCFKSFSDIDCVCSSRLGGQNSWLGR